jgi:hypothetical protein
VGLIDRIQIVAGLSLGAAIALKPQVGIFFLIYLAVTRRWRSAGSAILSVGSCFLVGVLWMQLHHIDWEHAYAQNLSVLMNQDANGPNSIVRGGHANFALINIQPLCFLLTGSLAKAHFASEALNCVATVLFILVVLAKRKSRGGFESISLASLLSLMLVYQRYYNAVLLLPVLVWALCNIERWIAKIVCFGFLSFLIGFYDAADRRFATKFKWIWDKGLLHQIWNYVVQPSANWFIVIVFFGITLQQLTQNPKTKPV